MKLAVPRGLEPLTFRSTGGRSDQTELRDHIGATSGTRTHDAQFFKLTLYRLSYSGLGTSRGIQTRREAVLETARLNLR